MHRDEGLAKDLDVSKQDLYRCIQFAKEYPEISENLRKLSWWYITRKLLPKSIHFLSESSEWTTPQLIIEKTIQLLKEIDLDPCSNPYFALQDAADLTNTTRIQPTSV